MGVEGWDRTDGILGMRQRWDEKVGMDGRDGVGRNEKEQMGSVGWDGICGMG